MWRIAPDAKWSSNRIIVTGGTGFLGRHVLARLRHRGVPEKNIVVPLWGGQGGLTCARARWSEAADRDR